MRKYLVHIIIWMIQLCMLISGRSADGSSRELHLFDLAYNSYLSYQPEKAVEGFRLFLEEFPHSSAKDAALFWYAKALLQIQSTDEAEKAFACIREEFPESPFLCYLPEAPVTTQKGAADHDARNEGEEVGSGRKTGTSQNPALPVARAEPTRDGMLTAYALQVGSFKTRESAEILKKSIQKKVARNRITICEQGDYFKVRITGFKDVEEINLMHRWGIEGLVIRTNEKACGL